MKLYWKDIYNFILKASPLFAGLVMSVYFQSRAFSIGFILAIVVMCLLYRRISLSKKTYLFIALCFLAILYCSIFLIKTDSSLGRILIYKISSNIYKDNWLWGIGLGEFKKTYMYYQATYFKLGNFTEKEFLLADNTYFTFNDYFQFVIETGIAGLFILLFSIIGLYKIIKAALAKSSSMILLYAIGLLLAICIAAFFNYVFYRVEFQVATLVCLVIILYYSLRRTKSIIKIFSLLIIFLILTSYYLYSYLTLNYYFASTKLMKIKELERAGYRTEAIAIAKTLNKDLDGNHEYLELTSFIFTNGMMLKEAKEETNKLIRIRPSIDAYSRLGYIYEMNNEYKKAEQAYLMAIAMVPNRFIPRYNLFKLFKSTGQEDKARNCAKIILNMPVKVPSSIVDQIKSNVKTSIY
jgi:tetratricopeptide (TPR) repeat protein